MITPADIRFEATCAAGVPVIRARQAAGRSARAEVVFTTRKGGVSVGPYASLNVSPHVGDDREAVVENRRRAARAVGAGRERLVSLLQVHGNRVVEFPEAAAGRGSTEADGVILRSPRDAGAAAALLSADCVPVVLVGQEVFAILHGGWRGLLAGVLQEGVRALGAQVQEAFVGPSIGPCCYEVGPELVQAFAGRFGPEVVRTDSRVDLWEAAALALAEAGVDRARVANGRLCTKCSADVFYSHRREGPHTGRQGALVCVHQEAGGAVD